MAIAGVSFPEGPGLASQGPAVSLKQLGWHPKFNGNLPVTTFQLGSIVW